MNLIKKNESNRIRFLFFIIENKIKKQCLHYLKRHCFYLIKQDAFYVSSFFVPIIFQTYSFSIYVLQ